MLNSLSILLLVLLVVAIILPLAVFILSYMQMSGWLTALVNNVSRFAGASNVLKEQNGGSDEED